ncbi:hypothetical protein ACEE23_08125 [Corynebacterium sp. 32222D000AT]|uniref:hypothetical protein n=1 Tax=Corynebacterium sp. LK2522 TaxID=3110474 RepID=UPI0034CFF3EC
MSKQTSFGYLRPPQEAVDLLNLDFFIDGDQYEESDPSATHWNYESEVEVQAAFDVDLNEFTKACGFDPSAEATQKPVFHSQLYWFCGKTKQKGASPALPLKDGSNSVSFEMDNLLLGGELQCQILISLERPGAPLNNAITAEQRGARMWSSAVYRARLEGDAAQMTITPVDFKEQVIEPAHAPWRIQIDGSLLIPVQAGIRVFINTNNPLSLRMLEKAPAKEKALWEAHLQSDILTQLLLRCSELPEYAEIQEDALFPGSTAETIFNLAHALFPGESISEIPNDFSRLTATVQAFIFQELK